MEISVQGHGLVWSATFLEIDETPEAPPYPQISSVNRLGSRVTGPSPKLQVGLSDAPRAKTRLEGYRGLREEAVSVARGGVCKHSDWNGEYAAHLAVLLASRTYPDAPWHGEHAWHSPYSR